MQAIKYGFILPGGNPRTAATAATEAESCGWDGVFVPDAISIETPDVPAGPWHDPWVMLAAMAMTTRRVRIGPIVAAATRRRPWKLAREALSIDHLSGGRLILAVGLGAADDDSGFNSVGEQMDLRVRAQMLDECLEVVDGLWKGIPLRFKGQHFGVDGMTMLPKPLQQPRVPVWVVGLWPRERSMRRALKWDGVVLQGKSGQPNPVEVRAAAEHSKDRPRVRNPFDVVAGGAVPALDANEVAEYEAAGATWWLECLWDWGEDDQAVLERIRLGPPRQA